MENQFRRWYFSIALYISLLAENFLDEILLNFKAQESNKNYFSDDR